MPPNDTVAIPGWLRLRSWYRGELPPNGASPLSLLIIQGSPFCNIDCRYCYLPQRQNRARFDLDLLTPLFQRLDRAGLLGDQLTLVWHAGEPLALPVEFYQGAAQRIAALAPRTRLTHNVQTNAMLVSDEYCALFRQHGFAVGVSIDGPAFLHDANRVTRRGEGTHAKAMEGIATLRRNGIRFSVIAVLTATALDHADEIFDFFRGLGAESVGFNVDETEGSNVSSMQGAAMQQRFAGFWQRVFQLARQHGFPFRIREFDHMLDAMRGAASGQVMVSSESNPLSIITVDAEGGLYTFSPELAGEADPKGGDFRIGHARDIEFERLFEQEPFRSLHQRISKGVAACRESCGHFDVCGGGAPSNKLAELGDFDGTETSYCTLTRKVMLEVVQAHLARSLPGANQTGGVRHVRD